MGLVSLSHLYSIKIVNAEIDKSDDTGSTHPHKNFSTTTDPITINTAHQALLAKNLPSAPPTHHPRTSLSLLSLLPTWDSTHQRTNRARLQQTTILSLITSITTSFESSNQSLRTPSETHCGKKISSMVFALIKGGKRPLLSQKQCRAFGVGWQHCWFGGGGCYCNWHWRLGEHGWGR